MLVRAKRSGYFINTRIRAGQVFELPAPWKLGSWMEEVKDEAVKPDVKPSAPYVEPEKRGKKSKKGDWREPTTISEIQRTEKPIPGTSSGDDEVI